MIKEEGQVSQEATVAEPAPQVTTAQEGSETFEVAPQEQTLHDFVLNLLNDSAARATFADDPAHALGCAGLGDITAQDVQEVIPLVMDYGQLPDASSLGSLADLPVGAGGLEGAIAQLQSVADVAGMERLGGMEGMEGSDFHGGMTSALGGFATAGTGGLDGVSAAIEWTTQVATGEAVASLSADGANIGSSVDSVAGHFAGLGGVGLESSGGGASFENDFASGTGMLDASLDGVVGDLAIDSERVDLGAFSAVGADGVAGGVALDSDLISVEGSGAASLNSFVAGGSMETPLGTYGVELSGAPSAPAIPELDATGDLADCLDTDALNRGSEAAASTLATYVTSGGAALGGIAPVNVPDAANLPTNLPANLPADVPANLPVDVPTELPSTAAEVARSVPETGSLPVDLPAEVPTDLPVDLPVDLPTSLPDLPVANPLPAPQDLPGADQVTDAVSSSPLGGVADTGQQLLSDTPGVGDLDLGH
ncbi:hypothetical protein FHU38_000300 [Saccharomonospora amisosensis]|uniref:Uncharacterized protein n=1 Tax=Saccharomonospora amisosensis TaxID=1128677 RepID=A0A7X5ZNZ5_9PSEU|nr:IniB N-terminal domain-containing protein [Saccharomonospora amisosensis]NIJ09956.1 hypothetical protein [Saccharomonospora amisosensis]